MANSTPADACRPMDAATHSDSPIDVTDAIADDTVADVTDATTANDRQRWCTGDTATPAFVGSPEIPPHRLTRRRGTDYCVFDDVLTTVYATTQAPTEYPTTHHRCRRN